ADGTLLVVGSGWHQGPLLVSLGRQQFPAWADAAGDFEVATNLQSYHGDLSVRHVATATGAAATSEPFGALFAQAIVEGLALLSAAATIAVVGARALRGVRRYPRH